MIRVKCNGTQKKLTDFAARFVARGGLVTASETLLSAVPSGEDEFSFLSPPGDVVGLLCDGSASAIAR